MIDATLLDPLVRRDLRETHRLQQIEIMSVREAFDTWLNYHGILGYTDQIIHAYESIKSSTITK